VNVLLDNLPLYAAAFWGTIQLFVVAAVGSLVLGLVLAGMRVSPVPILRSFGAGYVTSSATPRSRWSSSSSPSPTRGWRSWTCRSSPGPAWP
jgi:hypothetical protein